MPRKMPRMICRLFKNWGWIILFASLVAACAQVDPPTRLNRSAAVFGSGSRSVSHVSAAERLFGARATSRTTYAAQTNAAASTTSAAAAQASPPADPTQAYQDTSSSPVFTNGNFWNHMHADFQLPNAANEPAVQEQIRWYANHQQYLNRVVNRAAPYLYYILQRVQERDLPAELVLLPIMESAYNPFANSYRGAAGLWQLMTPTAYGFGVKQDWWYDGRRDIYASTNAALDYLTYLQSYFGGDWLLAIAAYDAGEGGIQGAVKRNEREGRDTDFWSLQLPMETRTYVPRLLALATIISNPGKYGITLPAISDQPYLQQVDIGTPINLSQAAQLANMSLAELKQFNPGYSHAMTDPNGPYKLLLPIDHIPTFKQNLAQMPGLARTTYASYRVQHGDSLVKIAKQYHTSVLALRQENHLKSSHTPIGKTIMVPTGTVTVKPHITDDNTPIMNVDSQPIPQANPHPEKNNSLQNELAQNTVAPTIQAQPVATDVTTSDLQQNNNVDNSSKTSHTVKAGETLYGIAKRYNVNVADIKRWNNLSSNSLKPGSKIIVSQNASSGSASSNERLPRVIIHTNQKSGHHPVRHKAHKK